MCIYLNMYIYLLFFVLCLSFLLSYSSPSPDSQVSRTAEDEEEEDGEYNFLADSLHEEEKEEFRNDRAVRIPRMLTLMHCIYMYIVVSVRSLHSMSAASANAVKASHCNYFVGSY